MVLERYRNDPDVYVSFVEVNKLGINPQLTDKTTPLGIYAYPIMEVLDFAQNRIGTGGSLYASDRRYLCVFRGSGNILDLSIYTSRDLERDLKKLQLMIDQPLDYATGMSPGREIWMATKLAAQQIAKRESRTKPMVWNGIFRHLGYDGVIDQGEHIMHLIESTQVVFFSNTSCSIITMLLNDLFGRLYHSE